MSLLAYSGPPAVAVLLSEVARTVRRIELDRQITLQLTPRIAYRVLLDVLARREKRGALDDPLAIRQAFAELVPPGVGR